jgi:hypothetical protein
MTNEETHWYAQLRDKFPKIRLRQSAIGRVVHIVIGTQTQVSECGADQLNIRVAPEAAAGMKLCARCYRQMKANGVQMELDTDQPLRAEATARLWNH